MGWFSKRRTPEPARESHPDVAYEPRARVRPEASLHEISERRGVVGTELRASVYLYDERKLLISSVSGLAEVGSASVLPWEIDDETLGLAVCDHLLAFRPNSPPDMRDLKLADWAVLRASGARSGKAFEAKAWMVLVETRNGTISFDARPRTTFHDSDVFAGGSSSQEHAQCGRALKRTLAAAMALRGAGFF